MLRLSRFRGRRGVFGSRPGAELWGACGGSCIVENEVCGWSEDVGAGSLLFQRREMSGFAADNGWRSRCERSDRESWRMSRRGQYRSYTDGPDADLGGRDEREFLLDVIEKDMRIQDDVATYLYSKSRSMDSKTLLGAMYIKAGFEPPRYSVAPGYRNKFMGTVVVRGKTFSSTPCDSEEEAEKSAADSALSWVLGQPRQGAGGFQSERGRGRGGGLMARGAAGGRGGRGGGRGRGRRGGGVRPRASRIPSRVPVRPRQCFEVEINYKLMSFVVLYQHPLVYYPFKEFPTNRFVEHLIWRPGFEEKPQRKKKVESTEASAEA